MSYTFEELLIEAVKRRPYLYDKSSVGYRDKIKKDKAWIAIATAVRAEVDHCKCRWKSLRDRFLREIQKQTTCEGSDGNDWEFLNNLEFLRRHVSPRGIKLSYKPEESLANNSPLISEFVHKEELMSSPPSTPTAEDAFQQWPGEFEVSCDIPSVSNPKRRRQDYSETLNVLMNTVTSLVSAKASESKSRNAGFLQVADEYLLKLPEQTQDQLKMKILSLIFEEYAKSLE